MKLTNRPSTVPLLGTSICRSTLLAAFSAFLALNVANVARAVDYYWDTNGTTAGLGSVSGTWGTSAFLSTDATGASATAATATTSSDTLSFGGMTGTGTVAGSGARVVGSLTLQQEGMTLSGGTITAADTYVRGNQAVSSVLNTTRVYLDGSTANALTLTGGSTTLSRVDGDTANVGTGVNSTVILASGNYSTSSVFYSQIGDATNGTGGVIVNSGATLSSTLNIRLYSPSATPKFDSRLFINGGTVTAPVVYIGANVISSRLDMSSGSLTASTSVNVAQASTSGTTSFNMTGGTATIGTLNVGSGSTGGSATVNISGGLMDVGGVGMGTGSSTAVSTINLSGGSLYIGASGITRGTNPATRTLNLSGGILGATAAWATAVSGLTITINLSNADGGVTFKAANASNTAFDITMGSALSGAGGLTKTGAGTLFLNALNSYTGDTILSAGLTSVGASSNIGGNVTIGSGASLTVASATAFANNAIITFSRGLSGTITLSSGADTIGYVYDTVSGTKTAVGTYTAAQLNTLFGGSNFAGTGTLVVTAVPEPSVYAVLAGSLVLGVVVWNRRRRSASALVA